MQESIRLIFPKRRGAVKPALGFLGRYVASSAVLFFGIVAQFIWFIVFARALGVEAFGQLMVIMAVTGLVGTLAGVGSTDAIVRRVSRDRKDYPAMLGHGLILEGLTGVALTLLATGILHFLVTVSPSATKKI